MTHPILLGVLLGQALAWSQGAPSAAPPRQAHLLVPGCRSALPLDEGHAFMGPRFLIWDDRITFFAEAPPAPAIPQGPPEPQWQVQGTERLPAAPPAAGLDRARVKWRDGALWMKAGERIYQRDATTGQWFLMADPNLDFRDFDVDIQGRILLIGTADPRTRRYRALMEAVQPDRRSTEVLFEYPDPDYRRWFDQISPVAAASLLTGYESVQIQEFLVLCNPLARRVFVYQALEGTLREARLGLEPREARDLATRAADPASPRDLCWQVLPKNGTGAWIIFPQEGADGTTGATDGGDPQPRLRAIALDLAEAQGEAPIDLQARSLPVFFDPQGRLTELHEALDRFQRASGSAAPASGAAPAYAFGSRSR